MKRFFIISLRIALLMQGDGCSNCFYAFNKQLCEHCLCGRNDKYRRNSNIVIFAKNSPNTIFNIYILYLKMQGIRLSLKTVCRGVAKIEHILEGKHSKLMEIIQIVTIKDNESS